MDAAGDLFIADSGNNVIREVIRAAPASSPRSPATAPRGYSGDGGPATRPSSISRRALRWTPPATSSLPTAQQRDPRGQRSPPALSPRSRATAHGYSGDGGPATAAELNPAGVAVDSCRESVHRRHGNNVIREVVRHGMINTLAGNGTPGFSGDGGPATSAELYGPTGIALDSSGNLYIADDGNNRIREVSTVSAGAQTVTVTPAPLTITANSTSKTYGATETFTGTEFTVSGLVTANGDSVTSVTLTSAGTAAAATVAGSPYNIVPSAAIGSGLSNYTVTYDSGTLSVNPYNFSYTIGNDSQTYGTAANLATTWDHDQYRRQRPEPGHHLQQHRRLRPPPTPALRHHRRLPAAPASRATTP